MSADELTLDGVLKRCAPLVEQGISLHWLVPGKKNPIDSKWAAAPTLSLDELRAKHRRNANIGVRLGEPSKTPSGYLHLIDLDIRVPEKGDEARAALRELLPNFEDFPSVISGSGGQSRHFYFFSSEPFRKSKIAKSEGYAMVFDRDKNRDVKKMDWEIDVMGTGSQAVIPPSVHPDTKKPYVWERELDMLAVEMGLGPTISAETIAEWGAPRAKELTFDDDEDDLLHEFLTAPIDLTQEEIDKTLADLPETWVEDRDTWYQVGMALHHQFQGDPKAFDLWCEWAQQSSKYEPKTQRTVWKSFKGDRRPVTMRTIVKAANDARLRDNLPDLEVAEPETPPSAPAATEAVADPLADLLGGTSTAVTIADPLADLLGGTAPAKVSDTDSELDALLGQGIPSGKPEHGSDDEDAPEIDDKWTSLLDRNDEGHPKSVLHNIRLIVQNDIRTHGMVALNDFTQEIVLVREPRKVSKRRESAKPPVNLSGHIWEVPDRTNGKLWTDSHDHAIRGMIEAPKTQGGYGMKVSDRDLKAAVDGVANTQHYHPIRNYLDACAGGHDGVFGRVEELFIKYLGSPDTPYHREAARLFCLGAVTRAFEPGHKFDFVVILEGIQGKRKSTFIRTLARDWFSELTGDFHNTAQMVEAVQGSWIIEIPELQGFSRADTNVLKGFISRQVDKARLAYDRRARNFPRQCIFMGSTNDDEYLRDHTGGRRFWPVFCYLEGPIDTDGLEAEIDMIWAEATLLYRQMRAECKLKELPLYLTSQDAAEEAAMLQESRRVEMAEDSLAGKIEAWLDEPLGPIEGADVLDPEVPQKVRNATCAMHVWTEMMGNDPGRFGPAEASRIGKALGRMAAWSKLSSNQTKTRKYGRQRVYVRSALKNPRDTVEKEL